ncbi:MAG: TetR/AcrR family transcriptional regulator [Sphaerochaeta sp.]
MQLRAERTRAEILNAAEEEFSEMGFYGARMDEIAKKAGTSKAIIYKYYGSKEDLYKTVFYNVYDRFSSQEKHILINSGLDYKAKIRHFVQMEFDYCVNNPSYVRMLMWENLNYAKYYKEREMHKTKAPIIEGLEQIVSEARKGRSLLPSISAKQLLLTLYGCCFNYFSNMNTLSGVMETDMKSPESLNNRIQAVTDMLIAYIDRGSND